MAALSAHPAEYWWRRHALVRWLLSTRVLAIASAITAFALSDHYSRLYYRNAVDDALTSLQYAKNLALGNGLVFNVGERVEGYTNFLWVMVMTALYVISTILGTDVVAAIAMVNCALAAVNMLLVYALGRKLWGDNWFATCLALILPLIDNSYTVWAALGLEGHLLGTCLLSSLLLASSNLKRRGVYLGLALAAAHMTRPDANLFIAVLFVTLVFLWLWRAREKYLVLRSWRAAWRDPEVVAAFSVVAQAFSVWLCVYGSYFAWRYHYYGWLFPNTYYLKMGGELHGFSRGLLYVQVFLWERGYVPLFAVVGLLARTAAAGRALLAYLALHTGYILYVGGDFFPGHRFFVAQIPLFALGVGLGVDAIMTLVNRGAVARSHERRPWAAHAAGVVVLIALVPGFSWLFDRGTFWGPLHMEIQNWRENQRDRRKLMTWLSLNKRSDASLATSGIGTAGFYGNFRVIDIMGIIDPVIAHRSVENFGMGYAGHEKYATADEILSQKPDYIEMGYLVVDYWENGYYLDSTLRIEMHGRADGIWRRDELVDTGRYLAEGALHFEPGAAQDWTASGTAFEAWPTLGPPSVNGKDPESAPLGTKGGYIDTRSATLLDKATGSLRSSPVELIGDLMVLRVGGGGAQTLSVSLLIDGQRVFSETGVGTDSLSQRRWPIAPYRGKRAVLEIVDDSTTGHLIVDEVVQWARKR